MYSGLDKEFKALKRNYKALVFHMFDRSSIRHPAVLIPSEQLLMTVPINQVLCCTDNLSEWDCSLRALGQTRTF